MSEATWMRLSKYIRIRNNILQSPDSLQVLQESVRYYSGCGYEKMPGIIWLFLLDMEGRGENGHFCPAIS